MALKRVWIPSPNYSSRSGATVRILVCHTAEGARTIESLGGYFQGNVSASSHVGADDKVNTVGEYVNRANKAWTQSDFNSAAVSIELCAFAAWSTGEWDQHPNMLANCAAWIAEEAAHYGLPITRLSASEAQGSGRGVCQHVDLGARGGGHHDCGAGFPMNRVLDMARGGGAPTPQQGDDMLASTLTGSGELHVWRAEGRKIMDTWQNRGETNWAGGQPGKGPAGWRQFATAAADIVSISAERSDGGAPTLFVECSDGKTYYTWQKGSSWNGGEPGQSVAGLILFAP